MRKHGRTRTLFDLRYALDRYAVFTATALFTLLAAAVATGSLDVPGGFLTLALYPAALMTAAMLRPSHVPSPGLRRAAAWSFLFLIALKLVPYLIASPAIAAGIPIVLGIAVLVAKFPAGATVLLLLTSGTLGSFHAFLGFSASPIVDLLLLGIWLALAARVVLGRPYTFVVWPAVAGAALYAALTIVDMLTSEQFGLAWYGFRTTVWYMLALFAIAYAGWSRETYRRIAIGFVGVTAAVAAYATLRWVVGPAGAEHDLAVAEAYQINVNPTTGSLRTVGSFLSGHQLAFWVGLMAPFCVAVAVWVRGWRRVLAVAAIGLCIAAIIASEARAPLGGLIAGVFTVLAIYQVSRAFPGFKAGIALVAISAVGVLGGVVFALGESDPDRLERYTNILDPGDDPTFVAREIKWDQVVPAIEKEPFGHGLGTGGAGQVQFGESIQISEFVIDNSFLTIAFEQGLLVMAVFGIAVIGLVASLALASARTPSRQAAALGMGACGALVSTLVSFYTGPYMEVVPVVAAWLVVGLGLSSFVAREKPAAAEATGAWRAGGSATRGAPA
jgi:hypothetical protein